MNTYKYVCFGSYDFVGTYFYVKLTETDSEATFQSFLEDAFTNFQDYIANCLNEDTFKEYADEYGNMVDEVGYEEALERIRENCYISEIRDVENEIPPEDLTCTTDEGCTIEF